MPPPTSTIAWPTIRPLRSATHTRAPGGAAVKPSRKLATRSSKDMSSPSCLSTTPSIPASQASSWARVNSSASSATALRMTISAAMDGVYGAGGAGSDTLQPGHELGDAMRLQVKGKNLEVSESIRRYAEAKMSKLGRQLHELTQVELELCVEKNPSISANQVAEATVLQLELVGHDFLVFRSDESGEVNVIYRRRDGSYGLIEPQ